MRNPDEPGSDDAEPVRVCFVCLGNICRSPTAEGVMLALVEEAGLEDRVEIDSAGTGGWHAGDLPDERARAEARRRGIELRSRARRFHPGDFEVFDLVVAMDHMNHADLSDLAPDAAGRAKVVLLRSFDPRLAGVDPAAADPDDLAVPDPYYGGPDGFADMFDMIDAACRGLLAHLRDGTLPAGAPGTP